MNTSIRSIGTGAAILLAGFFSVSAASAQATRTWISGVGDDVNPCSRTAPCKTFPGAISKTAAGGEIDTLDPGGFGAVTVTKAITLANEGIGEAGILVAGTNGITVNCATDPNCTVIVRGLQIDGGPINSNSLNGIRFIAGHALLVYNTTIRNFTGGSPNGFGIYFSPASGSNETLLIDNCQIVTNGPSGGTGGGVYVAPSGSPTVTVSINNTQMSNGGFGFAADSSSMSSGGSITATISDSQTTANQNGGVAAVTSAASGIPVTVNVNHVIVSGNGVGLNSNGSAAILRFGNSTVTGNATGIKQKNGGVMSTYGTNQVSDNPIPASPVGFTPTLVGPS